MKVNSLEKMKMRIARNLGIKLENAMNTALEIIQNEELTNSTDIKDKAYVGSLMEYGIKMECSIIATSRVWSYLNYGTGIYSDKHKGAGPSGEIVPLNSKVLHFKNRELASALGFKDENVFLAKVKGIQPRFFLEKMFETSRFKEILRWS